MQTIITVSDVAVAPEARASLEWERSVKSLLGRRVEALSPDPGNLVSCTDAHPLAQAAHDAFYEHRALVLSPDVVWFCLAQGFAQHINRDVEGLRERFVRHQGKLKLVVERPDLGTGPRPSSGDLGRGLRLYLRACAAIVALLFVGGLAWPR